MKIAEKGDFAVVVWLGLQIWGRWLEGGS